MNISAALRAGFSIDEIFDLTKIDRWFLTQIKEIVDLKKKSPQPGTADRAFHSAVFRRVAEQTGRVIFDKLAKGPTQRSDRIAPKA